MLKSQRSVGWAAECGTVLVVTGHYLYFVQQKMPLRESLLRDSIGWIIRRSSLAHVCIRKGNGQNVSALVFGREMNAFGDDCFSEKNNQRYFSNRPITMSLLPIEVSVRLPMMLEKLYDPVKNTSLAADTAMPAPNSSFTPPTDCTH